MGVRHIVLTCSTAVAVLVPGVLVGTAPAQAAAPAVGPPAAGLPLGPAALVERRSTRTLAPGVTITTIDRGEPDPDERWTVEVYVPVGSGSPSPDPDAPAKAVSTRADADFIAARLAAAGVDSRVEEVTTPPVADFAGGLLGFRVRVGRFTDRAGADAALAQARATGLNGASVFTGWDGAPSSRGPWELQVLTVDPRTFRGGLSASYGPDLENREPTSVLGRNAVAAVNAGFFVLDPAAGAPGDPAGVGVYGGRLLSEATNGRPALVVHQGAEGTAVRRLLWRGSVRAGGQSLPLDGIDRVPGLIRNCGGTADDLPTALPLHDYTCTDADEVVEFTAEFGPTTPSGPGAEAVLDRRGVVVAVRSARGGPLPVGGRSLQATGAQAGRLTALARIGVRLQLRGGLTDDFGRPVRTDRGTSILNGGPELVSGGRPHATPATDGMVHPGDPNFYYGWAAKRNPRTLAGVDRMGRTVLVTADGRSTASLGLTIGESASVAAALGLRQAINLDGGGSTTMVVSGQVTNRPSDAAGERPVGDALLVLPARLPRGVPARPTRSASGLPSTG